MIRFAWLETFENALRDGRVMLSEQPAEALPPARSLRLEDAEDWGRVAEIAQSSGLRWAGVWGDEQQEQIKVYACFEQSGDYLVIQVDIDMQQPVMPSHTPYYPAANRMERHLQDMFGIAFLDHPDVRRWTRHNAWPESSYPLRNSFPAEGMSPSRTKGDSDYPFKPILGSSVYQIPVGPVHAGIIEPGHFRFHAVGEQVLSLEQRLGYVHKGIEKIAVGRDAKGLARLAARVSGDSAVAHAWAACMAMEQAQQCQLSHRSVALRGILAERERIANHLGDIGAICNDVGFAFAHMQCSRLREFWQRAHSQLFQHRLLMDSIVPGGVSHDLDDQGVSLLLQQNRQLSDELKSLLPILFDHPSLEDRLLETGVLTPDIAKQLGVTGYVGKASGMDYDARRDHGYAPYDGISPLSPCGQGGDVAARLQIRAEEIHHSMKMLDDLLQSLPQDGVQVNWPKTSKAGAGLAIVEGWRGEIISYVRFSDSGAVARYFPRDPSWFSWPALEHLIHGNIVPDFPVCNKSVNGSYSGHDL